MKKGSIWLLVVLALVFFLFNVAILLLLKPQISGNAVEETNKTSSNSIKIIRENATNQVIDRCIISPPLYCNVWKVLPNEKQIILQIGNSVFGAQVISEVQVNGCEDYTESFSLEEGDAVPITLDCDITKGKIFNSEISVSYRKERAGEDQVSNGTIVQKIN
jgi:hypothetical protein